MANKFRLLQVVELLHSFPDDHLKPGARGTIVHEHTVPSEAYEVEFCDKDGKTIAMITVGPNDIALVD